LNEGLPNVILESLACETPVVAFDCSSGPREMIQHKENGLLVANQDVENFAEAPNLLKMKIYIDIAKNALQKCAIFFGFQASENNDLMKISLK
jgi:N-acetylgalactosamine-N,N'-diacetylbacillosaminyl-diphospho-undecaprenol 4-alpha-N-acetylgalactosaminyltransferase